jgi:hypothetical protein
MHDLDRIQMEFDSELDALESDEFGYSGEFEVSGETDMESPFGEVEEMELATELMGVSSEEELDQFIGKLFKKVGRFVGRVARPLGGVLKGIAKKALPFVGGALGSFIPIPGVGTAIGSALGGVVSKALEIELEGMSFEDQEFEMARRFVRIAGTAAKQAAQAQSSADPQTVVKTSVINATKQHVPGFVTGTPTPSAASTAATAGRPDRTGRWIRRGRKIILFGV